MTSLSLEDARKVAVGIRAALPSTFAVEVSGSLVLTHAESGEFLVISVRGTPPFLTYEVEGKDSEGIFFSHVEVPD